MAMRSRTAEDAPMMDINTTPLIDVMLVLLIMFILTIPMQTHAVKLDTPAGPALAEQPARNEIVISDSDSVLWNGMPVDFTVLRQYLDQSQTLDPLPELEIRPSAHARYEVVDKVLAVAKRAHVAKMGMVGNEAYAHTF